MTITKEEILTEFHDVPIECLLHYVLEKFDTFSRYMYQFKNKEDRILWVLLFQLDSLKQRQTWGISKSKNHFSKFLCIGSSDHNNYIVDYTATLIARDIFRTSLRIKYKLQVARLTHINNEINEAYFGNISESSKLTHIIKVVDENDNLCSYSQIYDAVLKFVIECEQLKLPLIYNHSNLYIPITGLSKHLPKEAEYSKMWGYD